MIADGQTPWLRMLPNVNATLNALSAVCLALGYTAIRKGQVSWHRTLMVGAFASSTLFLLGYLTRMALTGTHRFPDAGGIKTFYLLLLFSHMILAVVVLPLILRALYLACSGRFTEHRRTARIAWPIWMYVSVTGVVVYWMLYHLAPRLLA